MAVSEGSMKDFIKNFNSIMKSYQDRYGLDKNEIAALNDAHIRGATNITKGIASTGLGIMGEALLGVAAANAASKKATNTLMEKASRAYELSAGKNNPNGWWDELSAADQAIYPRLYNKEGFLKNIVVPAAEESAIGASTVLPFLGMSASIPASSFATAKETETHEPYRIDKNDKRTYKEQLQSALRKVNAAGGIPAAGTFNDSLNNSFLENLRNARSTKKSDIKEEPIRIIDKVQLPSVLNDLKSVKTIDTNILNDSNALREFLRSNGYK